MEVEHGQGAEGLITAPTFGPCCALCWERFKVGDTYRSIWPKAKSLGIKLGISVHPACAAQLDEGDLTRIFAALERKLALPIAVLNGRRVEIDHEILRLGRRGLGARG